MQPERYFYYCPKCGDAWFSEGDKCAVCGHEMIEAPHEYELTFTDWDVLVPQERHVWEARIQRLYDEVISQSPIFDINLYNRRDEIVEEDFRKFQAMMRGISKDNPYGVRCPYCNAANVRKISGLARAGALAFFGIFALGKSGKQWHCKNCGSDF